ncbi:medium-chain fatty acid-CoA ligase faa2, partial [Kickxella alabastrina]
MYKSFKVPSSEVPGYSATHRHPEYKDGTQNNNYANITTVYELFKTAETNYPKAEFLGTREFTPKTGKFGPFEWISTTDAAEITDEFGAGLDNVYAKYAPELDAFTGQQPLGIYSVNRAEWLLTELAGFRSRRYSVGVCDSAGVDCAEFIINHSGLQVIVCSLDKIPRMLDRMANTPKVKVIISMDKLDCSKPNLSTQAFTPATVDKLKSKAAALGLVLFDMNQVIQMGQSKPTQATLPKPSDYCTLCYSSGTTGAQKGVLTTHGGLIHAARSAQLTLKTENTTYLSFVPLVHCLDRYGIYTFMFGFIQIGFYSGDMNNLVDDMQTLRPTIIVAVPRLLNRIYDRIASSTIGAKGAVGFLSRMGFKSKVKRLQAGRSAKHALWDKLIFNKVANIFGGRV